MRAPPAGGASHQPGAAGLNEWGLTQLVTAVRWAALCLSLLTMALGTATRAGVVVATVLAVYAVARTVWPGRADGWEPLSGPGGRSALVGALGELALCTAAVGFTGWLASPFMISLGASCFVAGLRLPPPVLVSMAIAGIVAITASAGTGVLGRPQARGAIERLVVLGAVAILGSYSDWLVRAGRSSRSEELDRLRDLGEVNHLLLELHMKAASLPGALTLRAAVASTVSRLRDLLSPDVAVLLLSDPTAGEGQDCWQVTLAEGVSLPQVLTGAELPPALDEATRSLGPVCRSSLLPGEGVAIEAVTGLYAPLWARNSLIGLMAVERARQATPFGDHDREIVAGVARHAALAVDNARWFRRLRTLGADEERGRIARELHDRLGQSLAYVAISLDRLVVEARAPVAPPGRAMAAELEDLANEVRKAARDIRTKLSDLRVDIDAENGLAQALTGLLGRVEQRSGIATCFSADGDAELPVGVEREIARIAQEAIANAERHSGARHISVRLHRAADEAVLEVTDDGKGMAATAPLRRDAFGILGMRERADAIGASLAIASPPGQGTTLRLCLRRPGSTDRRWQG